MSDAPKHTPGPWKAVPYTGVGDYGRYAIIWCNCQPYECVHPDIAAVELEADAQLIAYAPEMLEALKLFYDWSKNVTKYPPYWLRTNFVDKCSEIIAKAEGRTP